MTIRLLIAAAVVLGIYGGTRWLKDRGMPTEPAPLEMRTEDLPLTLGEWKGEDVGLDPGMFEAIGAKMVLSRQYRNRAGRLASLHLAVFEGVDGPTAMPHSPEICYPAGGWVLAEPKYIPLDQSGTTGLAKFLPAARQGQMAYVLYWYQIDGAAYCSGDRQRQLIHGLRGRALLPPIVKVMLHTAAASPDEAEKTLKSLAGEVYAWTRGFH